MSALKAIRELIGEWRAEAQKLIPADYTDRNLGYKFLKQDNYAAGIDDCADELESALTAAEQELREHVERHLDAKQLIAVSFDSTTDASSPPKGRWIYLQTALDTLAKQIGQSDARVAAAFELAAHICDPPEDSRETDLKDIRLILAKAIRTATPPEATVALEKMLLERALQEAEWWLLREDWHMYPDHISKSCATCEHVSKLRDALTGEKKA